MSVLLRWMTIFVQLSALGALIGLIAGAVPSLHPAADSFAHFRLHFAVILTVCVILLALSGRGRGRAAAVVVAASIATAIGLALRPSLPNTADGGLTLVQFNLSYDNLSVERMVRGLREIDADIVTLQEVTEPLRQALSALSHLYPHQSHCSFARVGGVAILSKAPFAEGEGGCAEGLGLVWERIATQDGPVTVSSLHTHWPWPFAQHAQIDRLEPWFAAMKLPVIVAGDFNAAPWSHAVRRIERASRTAVIPGLRMTIGVEALPPLPAVPLPIDHILLSDTLCPLAARVGPDLGSDHWPVIAAIGREGDPGCP